MRDLPPYFAYPAFAGIDTLPLFFGIVIYAFEGISLVCINCLLYSIVLYFKGYDNKSLWKKFTYCSLTFTIVWFYPPYWPMKLTVLNTKYGMTDRSRVYWEVPIYVY